MANPNRAGKTYPKGVTYPSPSSQVSSSTSNIPQFSGKVEESFNGTSQGESYYVSGQKVGSVGGSGSEQYATGIVPFNIVTSQGEVIKGRKEGISKSPLGLGEIEQPEKTIKGEVFKTYTLDGVNLSANTNTNNKYKTGTIIDSGKNKNVYEYGITKPKEPKPASFKVGDIFTAIYPFDQPSGSMTTSETRKITEGAYFFGSDIVNPALMPIYGVKLAIAQRNAENKLAYEREQDLYTINTQNLMFSKGYGLVGEKTISTEKEFSLNPFTGFKKDTTSYSMNYPRTNPDAVKESLRWKGSGINLNFDKTTTTTDILNGDTTTTTTTTNWNNMSYSSPAIDKILGVSFEVKKYQKANTTAEKILVITQMDAGRFAKSTAEGLALTFGLEALAIPALAGNIIVAGGGSLIKGVKTASVIAGVSRVAPSVIKAGFAGLMLGDVVSSSVKYSKQFESLGMNAKEGAIFGALGSASSSAGFLFGASKGEISLVKAEPFYDTASQKLLGVNFGVQNPFGRSGKTLFHYVGGKGIKTGNTNFGLGFGNVNFAKTPSLAGLSIESGGQLSRDMLRANIKWASNKDVAKDLWKIQNTLLPKTNRLQSMGQSVIDVSQTKWFNQLNPAGQKEVITTLTGWGKGTGKLSFEGLGRTFKENAFWGAFSSPNTAILERTFGSSTIKAEKGIIRQAGDIDINFQGKAIPTTEAVAKRFNIASGTNYFSASEGKISYKGEKIIEAFGQDIPSLIKSPLGFKSQYAKSMQFSTGGDVAGQKLGESLTQKFSTIMTINVNPTGKGFTIAPRAGQEKSIADVYKIIGRTSEITKGSKSIKLAGLQQKFGVVALKMNPNIDLLSGEISGVSGYSMQKANSILPSITTSLISTKIRPSRDVRKYSSTSITSRPSYLSSFISSVLTPTPSVKSRGSKSVSSYPSSLFSLSSISSSPSSISSKSSKSSSSSISSSFSSSLLSSVSSRSSRSSKSSRSSSSSSSSSSGSLYGSSSWIKPSFSWAYPTRSGKTKGTTRKYQSSVGAFELGIYKPKKVKTKGYVSSGLELRGLEYPKGNYNQKVNKLLIGGF